MSADGDRLSETRSLCPTCLEDVPAAYVARDGAVYLSRTCPDHGETTRQVWASVDHWEWANGFGPDPVPDGDIEVEGDHACLAVVEVTEDCNLSCSFCFASSGPGGKQKEFGEVVDLLEVVKAEGGTRPVQFSGGWPMRASRPSICSSTGSNPQPTRRSGRWTSATPNTRPSTPAATRGSRSSSSRQSSRERTTTNSATSSASRWRTTTWPSR